MHINNVFSMTTHTDEGMAVTVGARDLAIILSGPRDNTQ